MKAIKDFLYDKNDILIALIILVLAAGLILWRMDVIMAYPQTMAEKTGTEVTTDESALEAEAALQEKEAQTAGEKEKGAAGTSSENGVFTDGVLTEDITVTIAGGSATAAVQSLIDKGLFESYEEFSQVCKAAGYTPENIKATTFTFEAGSTQTDIAGKVTQ